MAITTQVSNDNSEVKLKIHGRFDFDSHEDFGRALECAKSYPRAKYVLDFSDVTDIDSSALGMLLLLRDSLGGEGKNMEIIRCTPDILEEFNIVNFSKMFKIS